LELVKPRAYAGDASAVAALRRALSVLLRLLAPVLPFVTEEAWSWWNEGSIHRAPWPDAGELASDPGRAAPPSTAAIALAAQRVDGAALDAAADAIGAIRKAKSQARLSQKAAVVHMKVSGRQSELDLLSLVISDVVAAGHVDHVELIATNNPEM